MAQARPISMVMWAMLMFLLGGLSIFASLGGFVTANQAMSNSLASLQVGSSAIAMLILLAALFNFGGGVLGIMAGIGLLKVARWGWGVTLNRSTRDSYTRCHGHPDIARLRVLPVCQCCVA